MSIQPVKRVRAYEDIVHQLVELVRKGELKPGDRLPPERELATAFGVGRPTLRQALTVMIQAGVFEVRPGSGVFLCKPLSETHGQVGNNPLAMLLMTEHKDLRHILELRVGVEGEAAYLAALRREPEHVVRLTQAFANLEEAYATRGVAIDEDYQFHYAIAEATGNPVFIKVMASLADLFLQGFQQTTQVFYADPGRAEINIQEHRQIFAAVLDQRPEEARAAMMRHLKRVFGRLDEAEWRILDQLDDTPQDRL